MAGELYDQPNREVLGLEPAIAEPPTPPTLTGLEPASAAIDADDFEGHVRGTGFTAGTVIVWNGVAEPTRFVDDTDVWTRVVPSVVSAPTTVDVTVRNPGGEPLDAIAFEWLPADDQDDEEVDAGAAPAGELLSRPSGNGPLEDWQAWARACGATDADLDGMTRNQLRDAYTDQAPRP